MIRTKKGESIIEVLLAMAIFSVAAVSTVAATNFSLHTAQADLEITQARMELDAQAEALRFIHANYAASKTRGATDSDGAPIQNTYTDIWSAIKTPALDNRAISGDTFSAPSYTVCSDAYDPAEDSTSSMARYNAFAINTRALAIDKTNLDDSTTTGAARADAVLRSFTRAADGTYGFSSTFTPASTYPRFSYTDNSDAPEGDSGPQSISDYLAYGNVHSVEGIWVYGIPFYLPGAGTDDEPQYIDYYINTCWYPQGYSHSQTISTTIRLYNPDASEIAVTDNPAFYINYYYRDPSSGWTTLSFLTRAKLIGGQLQVDVSGVPGGTIQPDGYMISGWKVANAGEDAAFSQCLTNYPDASQAAARQDCLNTVGNTFKSTHMSAGDYIGLFCDKESGGTIMFHPECLKGKITIGSNPDADINLSTDISHISLVMVEKPPMDIAVIFDVSNSMKAEVNGAKKGLVNLGNSILNNTIGKASLTTISGSNTITDLCSLGYRYLPSTCGSGSPSNWTFGAQVNGAAIKSGNAPEDYMYRTVYEKTNILADPRVSHRDYHPAYTGNPNFYPAYNKMIILLTDTTANNRSYDIISTASTNKIRIYVIQSYSRISIAEPGTGGSSWNTALTQWGKVAADTGGAVIKADEILGDYSASGSFKGNGKYAYDWNSGELIATFDNGVTCKTWHTTYNSSTRSYQTSAQSVPCPNYINS